MNYLVIGIILLLVVTYPILYTIVRTKAGKKYAYSLAGLIIVVLVIVRVTMGEMRW